MRKTYLRYVIGMVVALCLFAAGMAAGNPNRSIKRYGSIIGVKPEMIETYKRLHAKPWPGVVTKLRECNIRNYSIFLKEIEPGKHYLFSYFEYVGNDFSGDMEKMAADPVTRQWWAHTDPCQVPVTIRKKEEFWASMEEVFHME